MRPPELDPLPFDLALNVSQSCTGEKLLSRYISLAIVFISITLIIIIFSFNIQSNTPQNVYSMIG